RVPGGHSGAWAVDIDIGQEPVRSGSSRVDRGISAGLFVVGLYLRNRQHAGPVAISDRNLPAAVLRLQFADAVFCRGRRQYSVAERIDSRGDGIRIVRVSRLGDAGEVGVVPCGCESAV